MTFRLAVSEDEHRFHVQWRIASCPSRHALCSKFTALLQKDRVCHSRFRFRLLVLKVLHFDPLPLRLATLPSSSVCTPSVTIWGIYEIDRKQFARQLCPRRTWFTAALLLNFRARTQLLSPASKVTRSISDQSACGVWVVVRGRRFVGVSVAIVD